MESQGFSFFTVVKISTTESVILHRVYYLKRKIMARPIRNTPILMGRDADRFLHEISVLPSAEERRKERARIQESAQQFLSLVMNVKKRQEACE